jgi:hypothetical protein
MTETVRQICTRAARKTGDSSEGQKTPVAYDMSVLRDALTAWYLSAVEVGTFGALTDVYKSDDYTAKENERVRMDAAITVTLPTTVIDRFSGCTRPPIDLSPVVVTYPTVDGYPQYNLYDAMLGAWVRLDGLGLDDAAPLSQRGPDGLASVVAVLVMEERGMEPGPLLLSRAARFRLSLAARHGAERQAVRGDYF